jgi:hypothetical protein
MPNIPDHSHILYPTGLVMDPALVSSGSNSLNTPPGTTFRSLPGLLVTTRRVGATAIDHPGIRGIIEVEVVAPALGAGSTVMELVGNGGKIRIDMDDSNRPECAIFNSTGGSTAVNSLAGSGDAIAEGTRLQIRLAWDSTAPVASGEYIRFTDFKGVSYPGTWDADPTFGWLADRLNTLRSGFGEGNPDFLGTLTYLQVGITP